MSFREIDLDNGESVYCINEVQLRKAFEMAGEDTESSRKIEEALRMIETSLSRNERAALSFILIDRLLGTRSTA